MSIWLWVLVLVLGLAFLYHTSTKVNFILKFAYLYCSYMAVSALIIPFCLPRPRHPRNGAMSARLLQYVNRLVPITFTIVGVEHLKDPTAAVLVLNHQSGIDLMAVMEIWPVLERAAPIAKKELKYAGPFGLACWLCGAVFIDRKSKTSHEDMNKLGTDAKASGTKLIVFPEGTRNGSKGLKLLPFKKGAFHVALDAKLPILPVVISEYDFLDTSRMSFQPGNVTIKVLARIETSEYSKETMDSLVSHTRGTMERELQSLAKTKTD
eukprot:TRINITY_DN53863_c0_g1_i1.p1 TRINITY_DN53863_c0_g1~~TRINITY_DN53863_c0_g1_i1.p1  ORF type:complete len:266 (+),score=74.11 TRINITY_DN53863_c0_g1_i1:71-868(+)